MGKETTSTRKGKLKNIKLRENEEANREKIKNNNKNKNRNYLTNPELFLSLKS